MSGKFKGTVCGIVAAVCYGTNPLGALPLYADGINATSVLFYRYSLACALLGLFLVIRGQDLRVSRKEFWTLARLGVMFVISSLTLFYSFIYMEAGVASTLLFVYPVMVAVLMAVFFKEKIKVVTVVSILLALCGIALLYRGKGGVTLSSLGVILVMLSSLSYALYIIAVNKLNLKMSAMKLTFYVLFFGTVCIVITSFIGSDHLQMLHTAKSWACAWMLALLPAVVSLVLMAIAVREIGSTPTAIMGALEPLTAVVIGILIFGESFTARLAVGIVMILSAVVLIVLSKSHFRLHLPFNHILFFRHDKRNEQRVRSPQK